MNERIEKLYGQSFVNENYVNVGPNGTELVIRFDPEKFAELIVKECLTQVDKVDSMLEDDKEKAGVAWVGLAIAKHFGVEE